MVAKRKRLPGRARPQSEALAEYHREMAACGERAVLFPLIYGEPKDLTRWRVQLSCQCIREVWTFRDRAPDQGEQRDPFRKGGRLPEGQMSCYHGTPTHWQTITEWGERTEQVLPADPVERPSYWPSDEDWGDVPPVDWAKFRRREPRTVARWTVALSCGHTATQDVEDLDWKPGDAPKLASKRQLDRWRQLTEDETDDPIFTADDAEHRLRWIALGGPTPDVEVRCYTCNYARGILAFERVGPLVAPPPKVAPKAPNPERDRIEEQLREVQAQAQRLRTELKRLDSAAD